MTTESFEAFTSGFLSKITSQINIHCEVKVTSDVIKLKVYFPESWEDIDIRILHSIVFDETKKNSSELEAFNFDKLVFFSFDGSKGKVTVKWLKILYGENGQTAN